MNKRQYKKKLHKEFFGITDKDLKNLKEYYDKQIAKIVDQILEINLFPKWLRVDEPCNEPFFKVEAVENE